MKNLVDLEKFDEIWWNLVKSIEHVELQCENLVDLEKFDEIWWNLMKFIEIFEKLKNEYLIAEIGFDTAENEPSSRQSLRKMQSATGGNSKSRC